jgi:hypothetical protein
MDYYRTRVGRGVTITKTTRIGAIEQLVKEENLLRKKQSKAVLCLCEMDASLSQQRGNSIAASTAPAQVSFGANEIVW